jgi:hypothetical protein
MLQVGSAIPFHYYFYKAGHFIPHIREWLDVPENNYTATVFKVVTSIRFSTLY